MLFDEGCEIIEFDQGQRDIRAFGLILSLFGETARAHIDRAITGPQAADKASKETNALILPVIIQVISQRSFGKKEWDWSNTRAATARTLTVFV
jgi:hypothetical protein